MIRYFCDKCGDEITSRPYSVDVEGMEFVLCRPCASLLLRWFEKHVY